MTARPHKLELYRAAVQHPLAEVAGLARVYRHYFKRDALLLREDFAGTCDVAATWCESHPQRQAMAVDHHGPTVRWAKRTHAQRDDLHIVQADVLDITAPRVDIVASLNFSTLIYHDRPALLRYFKHARRCLRPPTSGGDSGGGGSSGGGGGGVLVMDLYGGPGAMRIGTQTRRVAPPTGEPFDYHWEQRAFNPVTARTDCRIHFTHADGSMMRNAFRYDWQLWTPPEILSTLLEAGFDRVDMWCDRLDPRTGQSDGRYRPIRQMPSREDWVAYLVGIRG